MRKSVIGTLLPSLVAGPVIGLSAVISGIGVAALAFPGPLQAHLFTAIGYVLFGGLVLLLVVALTSSLRGAVALPQEASAAILGLLGLALHGELAERLPPDQVVPAVLAAMAACTVLTGLTFGLLGQFRLGGLIRFIPYPVVGGVLAGLGWLMVQGGISVLTGDFLTLANLGGLLAPAVALRLGAGAVMAVLLFVVAARWKHFLALPVTLLGGIAAFFLLAAVAVGPGELMSRGWLLGPFPEQAAWRPPAFAAFGGVEWSVFLDQAPKVGTLVLVSSISILLYASGIEVETRCDMDLNRELKACGMANVLAGAVGGMPGFHSMSDTILAREMYALQRSTAVAAAVFLAACLVFGFQFLAWMPRPVLAGLLFFLGCGLLYNWVFEARRRLPMGEWSIVLLILGVSAWVGYLEAISVGIVAGIGLFVVNYSRVGAVRHHLDGSMMQSNYDRSARARHLLEREGEAIQILTLQGFLFFGTAHGIFERLRAVIAERQEQGAPVRFAILDFRDVNGIDSSALLVFRKLIQFAEDRRVAVVFAGMDPETLRQVENAALRDAEARSGHIECDLDHALQWCEERLLEAVDETGEDATRADGVARVFDSDALADYLEPVRFQPGEVVIREGTPSEDLYIVREGTVTVRLDGPQGRRLRTYGPGTIVGEVAFYLKTPRSAWVVADGSARLDRLSGPALARMADEQPGMLANVHAALAALACERLVHSNRLIRTLT